MGKAVEADLSVSARRALEIVRDHGPIGGARFGHMMWPRKRNSSRGLRDQGAGFAGGAYLAKLSARGLIDRWGGIGNHSDYRLSAAGRAALRRP